MTLREEVLRNSGILTEMPVKKLEDARLFVEWGYISFKVDNSKATLVERNDAEFRNELVDFINNADKVNFFWNMKAEKLDRISCNIDNNPVGNFSGDNAKNMLNGLIKKAGKRNLISTLNAHAAKVDDEQLLNDQIDYIKEVK